MPRKAIRMPRQAPRTAQARSKYGAVRTNGYASKKEARRAAELKLLQRAGKIRKLREQVKFVLIPKHGKERECSYVADFVFEERLLAAGQPYWQEVVADAKGYRTDVYRLKRKLMLHVHNIRVREV